MPAEEYRQLTARPVEEALLWAAGNGTQPIRLDETTLLNYGQAFVAAWWSFPVWRDQNGRLAELNMCAVKYSSEAASSFQCDGSPDGGKTWLAGAPSPVPTILHHDGTFMRPVDFDFVQGHDLRIRFCFPLDKVIIIRGMIIELVVRGSARYLELTFA